MHKIIIFILFFIGALHVPARASLDFNYNCRQAYDHVTALRFNTALRYINAEKKVNPNNNLIVLIENYRDCMELIIDENKQLLNQYIGRKELRLKKIEKEDSRNPYYLYAQAEINLQWSFAYFKTGDYLNGVLGIRKAYKQLEKNTALYPHFIPNKKSLGLLHSLIGIVPDEYKWAVNLLGFNGSLIQGNLELQDFYNKAFSDTLYSCYRTEAALVWAVIQINFINDNQALKIITTHIEQTPRTNPVLAFAYADICLHQGRSGVAAAYLTLNKFSENTYFKLDYLNYLTGVAKLFNLENDAIVYLEQYVNNFKGNTFIKAAYLKMAYYYALQNNKDLYFKYLKQIPKRGNDMTDEDRTAEKDSKSTALPNIYLLKSRLLFDGGNYTEATKVLIRAHKDDFKTTREQLEFIYRLGRIQHKKQNFNKAIQHYQLVLKNGSSFPYYFAANAALNIGLIYEELENYTQAKYYFERCLKMKDHEYQRSIDQKAKAGIKRITG